ncbi:MAG: OmpA family protein [Myxococcales bacterium]|nr:OmpA family protein [Myxococcales bacterium]
MTRNILLCVGACLLAACGGRPTKTLAEAEGALADAALAKKCAPEEFAAAERMYAKAQKLADDEKFDEAETAAEAAKKLAVKARDKALARKTECEAQEVDPKTDLSGFIDKSGPGLDATDGDGGGMKTVYFDYNAFDLTEQAKVTMGKNADWLRKNPGKPVIIEGHCDSRGSTEYNLALGEKRAQVARKYLIGLGIEGGRLSIMSYGEEQPLDFGETEAAFARNRRAEFRLR